MGLKLAEVVPWGRSLAEYRRMFDLTEADLLGSLLDCGGGPASFNAELTQQGYSVISCDPLYQFSPAEIAERIAATCDQILQGVEANLQNYVWQDIQSPAHLGEVRMVAMTEFLADFPEGLREGRYQPIALPCLPFAPQQFDLALCSHLLFTYSDHLSGEFHLAAIEEMGRVAQEVRIFPLLNISGEVSPLLAPVLKELQHSGYQTEICPVAYEFQRGGDRMLRVRKPV